ncbi:MAG: DsbA family protein [Gammaproteobacteria bacterium]|nr:DsbA family protein [Gammaproteobacteria bacterium]
MTEWLAAMDAEPLSVCVDFGNPNAFLAVPPTTALAHELGLTVNWLPRMTAPIERPAERSADDSRGTRHRRFRAEYAARDIQRYAELYGLVIIRDIYRRPNVTLPSLGLLWARRAGPDAAQRYVEAVFAGHWDGSLDLQQPAELQAVLAAEGVDAGGFETFAMGEGRSELAQLQEVLVERGVFTVPTYLVAGKLFVGRGHLPMIRGLLTSS